jgi:outer membrane protein assembly factor BamB
MGGMESQTEASSPPPDTTFHVKHNSTFAERRRTSGRRRALLVPALLATILLATACARIASPKGWASPVSDGDTVIAQTDAGVVTAFRISGDSAETLWSYPQDQDDVDLTAVYATPILDANTVYIASYAGLIVALNIDGDRAGRPVSAWGGPIDIGQRIVATPVLRGDQLYVATERGRVWVIDAATGRFGEQPLIELNDRIWGRPAVDPGLLYVAALDTQLRAVDRSSGQVRWTRDVGTVAGDLVIDDDLLLVGSFDRGLHALDLTAEGAERWVASGDAWFWARPLVAGDTIYAATVGGSVYAFNRNTGVRLWSFHQDDTEIRAAPVLVDGVLLIASTGGQLYGINPVNGVARWTAELEGDRFLADPLVLESGIVLYTNDSGDLIRVTPAGDVQRLLQPG